jgi:ribose transport system ATP-binding protein
MTRTDEIIRFENITKRYGGVTALDGVGFGIKRGEIHAVVGENGAGKSTMMKLLAGIIQPDEGQIFIDDAEAVISSPSVSESMGITMVFQELNLFNPMSVTANMFINKEVKNQVGLINDRKMRVQTESVLEPLEVEFKATDIVGTLSTGQKQIVEIARAIHRGTSVVIMDEPNSALNEQETKVLFNIINNLKKDGITIIYVSHRLEEVFAIADRISVLRDGKYLGTWNIDEVTIEQIVTQVVGRDIGEIFPPRAEMPEEGEITLSVKNLRIGRIDKPVYFEARKGEILGFVGLEGSGVQEIFEKLFGLQPTEADCEITYSDNQINKQSPSDLIGKGWAFIPANRRDEGLMLEWPILRNISLVIIERLLNQWGLISARKEIDLSKEYIQIFEVATDSVKRIVANLSGGNQQKIVLAKWMATDPTLLILNDPTRGIDVGTKQEVYHFITDWARQGYTILLYSSEIEEIIGVCHRILVLYKGEIIREFMAEKTNKEEVMRYVLGGDVEAVERVT